MWKKNRTPIRMAILGVLLVALVFAIYSSYASEDTIRVGDTAPNFSLKQLDGTEAKLSDLRGQAVILNFWGSWCGPCKNEMPELERHYQQFKDEGLVVVGVNVAESPITVQQFVDQVGVTFPIWLDQKGKEVTKLYKVGPLPTTFFIDRKGKVADIFIGEMKEHTLKPRIAKILE